MGRQSARLYYKGKDHKDIYFQGKYHIKMYKGNKLLWEKLYPDKCLLTMGAYGIHIYDIEYKFFDFMPIYNSRSSINFLACVGDSLVVNIYNSDFGFKIVYSADAESFKETDIEAINPNTAAITIASRSCTDDSCGFDIPADDNRFTIVSYANEKLTYSKVSPYSNSESISSFVPGKGKYIAVMGYYRRLSNYMPLIYQVDNNGNIVDRVLFSNTTAIQVISYAFCRVGQTIYTLGYTSDYSAYVVGKINSRSMVIEWDIDNPLQYKVPSTPTRPGIISVSEKEVVATIVNANGTDVPILSFKEDGWDVANILGNGYVKVTSTSGDTVNVFLWERTQYTDTDTSISQYLTSVSHTAYMNDHQITYDGHTHGLFYSVTTMRDVNYNIYFDNPYLLESDGNICEKVY